GSGAPSRAGRYQRPGSKNSLLSAIGARQRRSKPSQPYAANVSPSGEKLRCATVRPGAREDTSCRVATSHNFIEPLNEAEANVLPLGEKDSVFTVSFCPMAGGISFQVVVFQNLMVSSAPQVARI